MFKKAIVSAFTTAIIVNFALSFDIVPERRRKQISTEFGYMLLPVPFSLPGVGSAIALTGSLNNVPFFSYETPTDIMALSTFAGDINAYVFLIKDLYLIPEFLSFSYAKGESTKAAFQTYPDRGMSSDNKKENVIIAEIANSKYEGGTLHLEFWDRRLSFFRFYYTGKVKLKALRNHKGDLIAKYSDDQKAEGNTSKSAAAFLDLTDDRADPRKGFRINYWKGDDYKAANQEDSDGYKTDVNVAGYIPMLTNSTLVLNYFRSDYTVTREGLIDEDEILKKLKNQVSCNADCDEEELRKQAKITSTSRKYGSATSMGGRERLRSYPGGRFTGGHSEFRGIEFRWNLTDENTPYNIWVMKDVRSNVQIPFFYEQGTVSEAASDLWKESRISYGSGIRVVTGSGFVYRLDIGFGDEGVSQTLWIQYPWDDVGN